MDTDGRPLVHNRRLGRLEVLDDPGLTITGGNIVRLEADLARLQARASEVSAKFQTFRALADAAQELLVQRGWKGGGPSGFIPGTSEPFPTPVGAQRLGGAAA
jgi:hypothetical protein